MSNRNHALLAQMGVSVWVKRGCDVQSVSSVSLWVDEVNTINSPTDFNHKNNALNHKNVDIKHSPKALFAQPPTEQKLPHTITVKANSLNHTHLPQNYFSTSTHSNLALLNSALSNFEHSVPQSFDQTSPVVGSFTVEVAQYQQWIILVYFDATTDSEAYQLWQKMQTNLKMQKLSNFEWPLIQNNNWYSMDLVQVAWLGFFQHYLQPYIHAGKQLASLGDVSYTTILTEIKILPSLQHMLADEQQKRALLKQLHAK